MPAKVQDLMTSDPATITPDASVREAARLMMQNDVGPLPVVEGGKLVGIVTDRDLVVRVLADGRDPDATQLREAFSPNPITVSPEDDLETALALLAENQVRRVPVVEDERLVGIVAQADIARELESSRVGEVVEEISRDA
jgi:CBS domain-containing protein